MSMQNNVVIVKPRRRRRRKVEHISLAKGLFWFKGHSRDSVLVVVTWIRPSASTLSSSRVPVIQPHAFSTSCLPADADAANAPAVATADKGEKRKRDPEDEDDDDDDDDDDD